MPCRKLTHKSVSGESLRFPCEFCGIVKDHQEGLRRHLRKYHTEIDDKVQCEVCNKYFHRMDLTVSRDQIVQGVFSRGPGLSKSQA